MPVHCDVVHSKLVHVFCSQDDKGKLQHPSNLAILV